MFPPCTLSTAITALLGLWPFLPPSTCRRSVCFGKRPVRVETPCSSSRVVIRCVRLCPQLLRSRAVSERRRREGRGSGGGGPGRLQPVQRGHRHRRGGALQTPRPAGKTSRRPRDKIELKLHRIHVCDSAMSPPPPSPQPGCKYQIQLRAEGNDHIERALPQQRWVEVRRTSRHTFPSKCKSVSTSGCILSIFLPGDWCVCGRSEHVRPNRNKGHLHVQLLGELRCGLTVSQMQIRH